MRMPHNSVDTTHILVGERLKIHLMISSYKLVKLLKKQEK